MSTLTTALQAAIADPADLEPLRELLARGAPQPEQTAQSTIAKVFAYAITLITEPEHGDGARLALVLPALITLALLGGADRDDLLSVICEPTANPGQAPSAGWADAAMRLAAWADAQVCP